MGTKQERLPEDPAQDPGVLLERLKLAETHRGGLIEHARNLEQLATGSTKHAENLQLLLAQHEQAQRELMKHIANLEQELREKTSDLRQSKELLGALEARVYRFEQVFAELGYDLSKTPR